ncbi:MAG TPA: DUF5671 domain-containing protein [Bryobacteraceae bacterium]|jgi:hypothetical protein|nr:DUF5671 domain-containing protein [Bryobacteraceae bacterium]
MTQEDRTRIQDFVEASKSKGASDEFLAALLTRRGWGAGDIYGALGEHWERATGLAVPERAGAGESARDAFFYLLSFSTLATWTTAVGSMLFEFINHWFPDAVSRSYVYDLRRAVTWQMACVVVAFPIYLLVMRTILREAAGQPEKLESGVRKWLTYLALLGTAGAMICDLIWFLDYFLTGELTARFMLKAATVMLIAGGVFAYYIGWLKGSRPRGRVFGIGSTAAVVITLCIGLGVAGTPAAQRRLEADIRRADDLRSLSYAVKAWHDLHGGLPGSLGELNAARIADPETGRAYGYQAKSAAGYELCADFHVEGGTGFWRHGAGRSCFPLDASKSTP